MPKLGSGWDELRLRAEVETDIRAVLGKRRKALLAARVAPQAIFLSLKNARSRDGRNGHTVAQKENNVFGRSVVFLLIQFVLQQTLAQISPISGV